jgi:hypothetical protein
MFLTRANPVIMFNRVNLPDWSLFDDWLLKW